jgi:hypothetical protein
MRSYRIKITCLGVFLFLFSYTSCDGTRTPTSTESPITPPPSPTVSPTPEFDYYNSFEEITDLNGSGITPFPEDISLQINTENVHSGFKRLRRMEPFKKVNIPYWRSD